MNNLVKNLAIWMVIGVVLMTVFNQFNARQAPTSTMEYSQFLEEAKAGYGRLSALLGQSPEDPVEAFRHLTRLGHEARKLLFLDPGLPQELLGPDFPGPKVRRLFLSAREELRARAAPFLKDLSLLLSDLSPVSR